MKEFEYYLEKRDVKKQIKNPELASALMKSALDRIRKASNEEQTEINAKYILENAYEGLREVADAKLALEGFKSYSHEASIIFLKRFPNINQYEIDYFDHLRYLRNGIKYYGKDITLEEAKESLEFAKKLIVKLKGIIKINKS